MIATGSPEDDGRNTEVIDVEDSTFSCTKVETFPVKLYGATGGLMNGQKPFICGGCVGGECDCDDNCGGTYSKDCYQLTETGSWVKDQTAKLYTARLYAGFGSVLMNNKLYLIGGYNGYELRTIEMLSPNTIAQTHSVQLPTGFSAHCQVPWDSENILVIGGDNGSRREETYFINYKNNQLKSGPSLNTARNIHVCGQLDVQGKSYIIVTGGYDNTNNSLRSTEVLDKNNVGQGWQKGKNLKYFLNICLLYNILLHFRS